MKIQTQMRSEEEKLQAKLQTVDGFVRQRLKAGFTLKDSELMAKEWLETYANEAKDRDILHYEAYHRIPKHVESWRDKASKEEASRQKAAKERIIEFRFKKQARYLLEQNRYVTIIDFEDLKAEEYAMIVKWFEEKKPVPDYLKGVIKRIPTFKDKVEDMLGDTFDKTFEKAVIGSFYLFMACFFICIILLNI